MGIISNYPLNTEHFKKWLRLEAEINDWRRIVRVDDTTILISKFEEDFARNLHQSISQIPELLKLPIIKMQYTNSAMKNNNIERTKNWYHAVSYIIDSSLNKTNIDNNRVIEIQAGIDSIYSILETILWTSPKTMDTYKPHEGEITAYEDLLKSMENSHDIFTKYYGNYENRKVVNHCPGAIIAKTLITHAWEVCTKTSLK